MQCCNLNAIQYNSNALQYNTMQCNTNAMSDAIQYNSIPMQYNTILPTKYIYYNIMRYNPILAQFLSRPYTSVLMSPPMRLAEPWRGLHHMPPCTRPKPFLDDRNRFNLHDADAMPYNMFSCVFHMYTLIQPTKCFSWFPPLLFHANAVE